MAFELETPAVEEISTIEFIECELVDEYIVPAQPSFELYLIPGTQMTAFYEVVIKDTKVGSKKVYACKGPTNNWTHIEALDDKKISGFSQTLETSLGKIVVLESGDTTLYVKQGDPHILFLEGEQVTNIHDAHELSIGGITEFELDSGQKIYIYPGDTGPMFVDGERVIGCYGWRGEMTALGRIITLRLERRGTVYILEGARTALKIDQKLVTEVGETFETSQGTITEFGLEGKEKIYVKKGEQGAMRIDGHKVKEINTSNDTKETSQGLITEFQLENGSDVCLKQGETSPMKIGDKNVIDIGYTCITALGLVTSFITSDDERVLMKERESAPFVLKGQFVTDVEGLEDTSIGKLSKFILSDGTSCYIRVGESRPFLVDGEEIVGFNNAGNGTLFTLASGKNIFVAEKEISRDTIPSDFPQRIGAIIS